MASLSSKESELPVLAILYPVSESAQYSTNLRQNRGVVTDRCHQDEHGRLPSPASSQVGDIEELVQDAGVHGTSVASRGVPFRQTRDMHFFGLGSDLGNFFVLKHPDRLNEAQDLCWINRMHCQFYHDPDSSDMWLKNSSTSIILAEGCGLRVRLSHGESAPLLPGSWEVCLGHGLNFRFEIFDAFPSLHPGMAGTPLLVEEYNQTPRPPTRASVNTNTRAKQVRASRGQRTGSLIPGKPNNLTTLQSEGEPAELLEKQLQQSLRQGMTSKRNEDGSRANTSRDDSSGPQIAPDLLGLTCHSKVEKRTLNGRPVAVKICRRSNIPEAADMWFTEVRMLNSLGRHENIVSILGSDAIKREITLSYESGQSLDKFVDRQFVSTLTDMDCQHIWRGLAGALSWIHDQGKLYNDLKPSNTMFDPRLRKAVLIDFGLASDKLERSFSTGGTPWYVTPEYLLRQRSYASDVWSLGVLMLFALGLLKLPDETEQSWKLNQVLDEESPESTKMIMWIRKVSRTKNAIPARWEVLRRVLEERASKRIRSSELLSGETNKIALLVGL